MAIPYTPQAWADGSGGGTPESGARLAVMEAGIRDAHLMPAVGVTHNAAQSITNSTNTILAFNTERFDQAGGGASTQHDTVTNNSRLTCRYDGIYQIVANVDWASNVTGERLIEIVLNAGLTSIARVRGAAGGIGPCNQLVTRQYALVVNDYVQLQVFQTSGGALNVTLSGNHSPEFSMVRVA